MQFSASAHQGMADNHVGRRELQAITDRNKGTRITAMTMEVDPGHSRVARIAWNEKPEFDRLEPKSQPELAYQSAALSDPIQPFPSQALGRGLALTIRHQ